MPSNYPGALDVLPNPTSTTLLDAAGFLHDEGHANLGDAIEAIQAELGLNPSGSYATVVARLNDIAGLGVFSVKAHGAVGDGVANDTAAIQAAIDAAEVAGGVVFFPRGTYLVSAALVVNSPDVTLEGEGDISIIRQANLSNIRLLRIDPGAHRTVVTKLKFDGNKANQTLGNDGQCIRLSSSTGDVLDVRIIDVTIVDSPDNAIRSNGVDTGANAVRRLRISNCRIRNSHAHSISLLHSTPDAIVSWNEIETTVDANANGIWIGNASPRPRVIGNHIKGTGDMGMEIWQTNDAAVVALNVVENAADMGISIDGSPGTTVYGNTLKNVAQIGIEFASSRKAKCIGNRIEQVVAEAAGTGRGITSSNVDAEEVVIIGNTIKDCADNGIYLHTTAHRAIVKGNVIEDCDDHPIEVNGAVGCVIEGNIFIALAGTAVLGRAIQLNADPFTIIRGNLMIDTGDGTKFTQKKIADSPQRNYRSSDNWYWNGTAWLSADRVVFPYELPVYATASLPTGWAQGAMAWDSDRDRMVIFDGVNWLAVGLAGAPAAYTETNVTVDRSYDANLTTVDELADVLGTLIQDLRARGVVA